MGTLTADIVIAARRWLLTIYMEKLVKQVEEEDDGSKLQISHCFIMNFVPQ